MPEKPARAGKDRTHIAIAVGLFFIAAILYTVGQALWAGLFVVGAIFEIGAWALLMSGSRDMPKVEDAQAPVPHAPTPPDAK